MSEENTYDDNRNVCYFHNLRIIAYFLFLVLYNGVLLAQDSTAIYLKGRTTIINELKVKNLKAQKSTIYLTNEAAVVDYSVIKNYDLAYLYKKERKVNHKLLIVSNSECYKTQSNKLLEKKYDDKKKNNELFFKITSEQKYFNCKISALTIGILNNIKENSKIERAPYTLFEELLISYHRNKFSVSIRRIKNNSFSKNFFTRPPPLKIII